MEKGERQWKVRELMGKEPLANYLRSCSCIGKEGRLLMKGKGCARIDG